MDMNFWLQIAVSLLILAVVLAVAVSILRWGVAEQARHPERSDVLRALEDEARVFIKFAEESLKAELTEVGNDITKIDISKWSTAWYNALPNTITVYGIVVPIGVVKQFVTAEQWRLLVLHCIQNATAFIDSKKSLLDTLTADAVKTSTASTAQTIVINAPGATKLTSTTTISDAQ